jgi:uncharacterized protein
MRGGALLVSRTHAVYCRVPPPSVSVAARGLAAGDDGWSASLDSDLQRHGFFSPPRPAAPTPPTVQLQLTNACNLACGYCCTNSGSPRARELPYERWLEVLDDVVAILGRGTRVSFLGGEPFLVPFAIDLAEAAAERGLQVVIFTNGTTLTREPLARRVSALIARGAVVRVSLAGVTPATCDPVSGAPRFERVLAAVRTLARFGSPPTVDVMLEPDQIAAVATGLPALRAALPRDTRVALGLFYRGGREAGARVFRSRAELETALDRVAMEAGERIAGAPPSPLAARREACSCALGHHLHVRSDGALFTCFKMEERVGDLGRERFRDALARVRANPRPASALAACAGCALATLCGGGCRAENVQLTGDPDVPACGPWRVRVLSELLAEDRPAALEWPAAHLLAEAHARGIDAPAALPAGCPSRHLLET